MWGCRFCIFIFIRICTERPVGHIYCTDFLILSLGQCVCESPQRYLSLLHACYCIYGFHALCHDNHFGSGSPPQSAHIGFTQCIVMQWWSGHHKGFSHFCLPCLVSCVLPGASAFMSYGNETKVWHSSAAVTCTIPSQYQYLPPDTAGKVRRLVSRHTNDSQEGLRGSCSQTQTLSHSGF